MIKKKIIFLFLIIILLVGGIVAWKLISSNQQQKDNLPLLNKLSDQELEKCLLEDFSRRLELKKYFVFNLQKEVKPGKHNLGTQDSPHYANNGRDLVPSLSNHLTKLIGEKKTWLVFQGKYTNEDNPEWSSDKLDDKINNGEEWYIIFDKTQVNKETCNWFANSGLLLGTVLNKACVLAVENKDNVWILKSKQKALEKIKSDPALQSKN